MEATNIAGSVTVCEYCGRPLDRTMSYIAADGFRYVECVACKNKIRLEGDSLNSEAAASMANGKVAYKKLNFEDAISYFEEVIKQVPDHHEAYWFRLLAENGIEYQKDLRTDKMLPTCHRCSETPLMKQKDYLLALKYAPAELRANYEERAKAIDAIREQVFNLAKQGEEYDVFISFKKTDIDKEGNPIIKVDDEGHEYEVNTQDLNKAERLYLRLKERNLRVFFSEESLKNRGGANFEATIFRALDTAKVFILIGSKAEYVNSNWVKNEWRRYLHMMSDGKKSPESFLYIYENSIPKDLNPEITAGNRQGLKYNDNEFWDSFNRFIEREMLRNSAPMERRKLQDSKTQALQEVSTSLSFKGRDFSTKGVFSVSMQDEGRLELAKKHLSGRNFSGAEAALERLLITAPNSAELHYLKMLAQNGISSEDEFYKKAFNQPELIDKLDGVIGYCGEKDKTLATVILLLTKLFAGAVRETNVPVAEKTFMLLCQCSNVPYVKSTLSEYTASMWKLARTLFLGKNFDTSARVFGEMLNAIGLDDALSSEQKSESYANYNYEYAVLYHQNKMFDKAANYYNTAIKYNPNVGKYYFAAWQNKYQMASEKDISGPTAPRIPSFNAADVELVLTHTANGKARTDILKKYLNVAVGQVQIDNAGVACQLFEYIIAVIPNDDLSLNKEFILQFSKILIEKSQFEAAEKYLHELLKITSNNCSDAFWKLIFVETRCNSREALMKYDKIVDISNLENYESAWACGNAAERAHYEQFSASKLSFYERSREAEGFRLLEAGKFNEAKVVFENLLKFEKETRKRNHTRYPRVYWGLLLVDTKCRNNVELASRAKRAEFPDSKLRDMPNYTNYVNAHKYYFKDGKEFSYEEQAAGDQTAQNAIPQSVSTKNEADLLAKERQACAAYYSARATRRRHIAVYALLLFAFVGFIGGGIFGSFVFFSYNISQDWFNVLKENLSTVLGVTLGGGAAIGAVIGFFIGAAQDGEGAAIGGAIGGGIGGVICGGVLAGLIFASCWALVPIITLAVLVGIGIGLKKYADEYLGKERAEEFYEDKIYTRRRGKSGTVKHKKARAIKGSTVVSVLVSIVCLILIGACLFSFFNLPLVYSYVHWGIILAVACVFALVVLLLIIFLGRRRAGRIVPFILWLLGLGAFVLVLVGPVFNDFELETKEDLALVKNCPYGNYIMTDDIDMEQTGLSEIDFFLGTFDGDGHAIYNIGEVANTWMDKNYGEIRNVTIAGGSFASTLINENQGGIHDVTFAGNSFAGALIDENNDKLDNITFMNLELYAPLIRVNKGDLNNIRLNGIEATIGGGDDTAMFVALSQEGSITNVLAEDIDLTVNSDRYSFGALIGSASNTYLSQIGIRDSEITISSTCTSSCMAGLVGSLNSNLTESFAEDVTFRLSDLSISNSSVAGLVGSLTDPNVTVSNSYSYGLVFTGTWNGKISGLIGEAGSVHVDHLYSHVDKTASTVYLDDDIQFTGIYTIVKQDRDAGADSVWYNAGFSTYTYSGSLFGGGASSISGTNLYGTKDFDIENGSKAIQMLGLDRAIWETLYGGRPVLSWAN